MNRTPRRSHYFVSVPSHSIPREHALEGGTRQSDLFHRSLLLSLSVIVLRDFYDITPPHLASALRSDANDPISSNFVSQVQAMRIKHCYCSDLFAGCGIVED